MPEAATAPTAESILGPFWNVAPFTTPVEERRSLQAEAFGSLTAHHQSHCDGYARILSAFGRQEPAVEGAESVPYLPVPIFKLLDLASVPASEIVRTMTSSGTSGGAVSRIHLDRDTAKHQARALAKITGEVLGNKRLPMVIVDHPGVLRQRTRFDARAAAIVGFSPLARSPFYLLDDETGQPDWEALQAFLAKFEGERILVFGMTYMVWKNLYQAAERDGVEIDFGDSVLLHGGGWKKMADQQVDARTYRERLRSRLGIRRVCNYYGMAEQTGSIFLECEEGRFHASAFSEVIVRDPVGLEPLGVGEEGILQVLSVLPTSYPGHSLLTEDRGTLLGEDDCPCGWLGRTFSVHGRLPAAELKGCSDAGHGL